MSGECRRITVAQLREGDLIFVRRDPNGDNTWKSDGPPVWRGPMLQTALWEVTRIYQDPTELDVGIRVEYTRGRGGRRAMSVEPPETTLWVMDRHHPVCSYCDEVWPCTEHRIEIEVSRAADRLDDLCHHCGKEIGNAWRGTVNVNGERRRYHVAPSRKACHAAYNEAATTPPPRGDATGASRL